MFGDKTKRTPENPQGHLIWKVSDRQCLPTRTLVRWTKTSVRDFLDPSTWGVRGRAYTFCVSFVLSLRVNFTLTVVGAPWWRLAWVSSRRQDVLWKWPTVPWHRVGWRGSVSDTTRVGCLTRPSLLSLSWREIRDRKHIWSLRYFGGRSFVGLHVYFVLRRGTST